MSKTLKTEDFLKCIETGQSHLASYNTQLKSFLHKFEAPNEDVQKILLATQANFAETMTRRHESERNAQPMAASIPQMDGAINNLVTIAGSYYCTDGNERPIIAMQMLAVQENLKNYRGKGGRIYRGALEIVKDTVESHMVDTRLQTGSFCKLVQGSRNNWQEHRKLAEYTASEDVKYAIGDKNVAKVVNAFVEQVDPTMAGHSWGWNAQESALDKFQKAKIIFEPEELPALNEKLIGCDESLAAFGYRSDLEGADNAKRSALVGIRTSLLSIGGYGPR